MRAELLRAHAQVLSVAPVFNEDAIEVIATPNAQEITSGLDSGSS
jgi:hypothetical protein